MMPSSHLEGSYFDLLLGKLEFLQEIAKIGPHLFITPFADLEARRGRHKETQQIPVLLLHDEGNWIPVCLSLSHEVDVALPVPPEWFFEAHIDLVNHSISNHF